MKHVHVFLAVVACAAAAGMVSHADANLIVNGGFETGDFTGWTVVGPAVDVFAQPFSGDFSARYSAGGNTLLSQSFAVTPGTAYVVEFWIQNLGVGEDLLNLTWQSDDGMLVLINDSPLTYPLEEWVHVSFEVENLTAEQATLAFIGTDDISAYFIDDISVTAVPGPGILATFALAGLISRRRRN